MLLSINHALDCAAMDELMEKLAECKELTLLESAKMSNDQLIRLFAAIKSSTCCKVLRLQKIALDEEERMRALCDALDSQLQSLYLISNQLCRVEWLFNSALSGNLRCLFLGDTIVSNDALQVLISGLSSPDCKLNTLHLVRNQIGPEGSMALANKLPSFNSLQCFEFSGNFLAQEGARAFASALLQCNTQTLQRIKFNNDQLGGDAFGEFFPNSFQNLFALALCNNQLIAASSARIARLLATPDCALVELDLSYNHLGDTGVQRLSRCLYKSRLEILLLRSNKIGSIGVSALASAVQHPKSRLIKLDVSFNEFGYMGGLAMLKAIKNNPVCRLTSFLHHCNRITNHPISHQLDYAMAVSNARRVFLVLRSAQQIPRLGRNSPARLLPYDLCRALAEMLSDPQQ